MQMNRVVIAGHVWKKPPEARYLASGTPVVNVRVGETVRYVDGSGETKEQTNWHSLIFYGKLTKIAQALDKGDNVYVDGRIEQRKFTPRDGKTRTVHEIVVRLCHVIAPARNGNKVADAAAEKDAVNGSPVVGAEIEDDWPVES
jgi:single-strand DNA-binding protein